MLLALLNAVEILGSKRPMYPAEFSFGFASDFGFGLCVISNSMVISLNIRDMAMWNTEFAAEWSLDLGRGRYAIANSTAQSAGGAGLPDVSYIVRRRRFPRNTDFGVEFA